MQNKFVSFQNLESVMLYVESGGIESQELKLQVVCGIFSNKDLSSNSGGLSEVIKRAHIAIWSFVEQQLINKYPTSEIWIFF